ncbi:cytochrome c biogenesis protein CcsA [Alienimonas californiensis]|uniref:Cytochrome C assembly protein n=1 Tax=Alienimonas californiensis TaxID=2527989 RepID=A0A517PCN7_9PLAN|nr:cytochrome c biogenesis protein CcsA [Alienimonas californiensis]QDT17148.1 Cytochrome C assembly protein [Alienimonas californiensis]
MSHVTVFCFLASYAVALTADALRLWGRTVALRWIAWIAAAAGLLAHTWYLALRYTGEWGEAAAAEPWGGRAWILALAWLGAAYYVVATGVERRSALGVFLWPLVLGLVACSYAVPAGPVSLFGEAGGAGGAVRAWAILHAALLLGGLLGVLAGVVTSAMYLVHHRRLRAGKFDPDAVPLFSLERLDRWNRGAVAVAVPLLVLGVTIGLGLVVAGGEGAVGGLWDPVVIGTTLGVFAAGLAVGGFVRRKGQAGRGVALRTLLAFGFLLVTVVGLQVLAGDGGLLESWHAGGGATP